MHRVMMIPPKAQANHACVSLNATPWCHETFPKQAPQADPGARGNRPGARVRGGIAGPPETQEQPRQCGGVWVRHEALYESPVLPSL